MRKILFILLCCLLVNVSFASSFIHIEKIEIGEIDISLYFEKLDKYIASFFNKQEIEVVENETPIVETSFNFIEYKDDKLEYINGSCVFTEEFKEELEETKKEVRTMYLNKIQDVNNVSYKLDGCYRIEPNNGQAMNFLNPTSYKVIGIGDNN